MPSPYAIPWGFLEDQQSTVECVHICHIFAQTFEPDGLCLAKVIQTEGGEHVVIAILASGVQDVTPHCHSAFDLATSGEVKDFFHHAICRIDLPDTSFTVLYKYFRVNEKRTYNVVSVGQDTIRCWFRLAICPLPRFTVPVMQDRQLGRGWIKAD